MIPLDRDVLARATLDQTPPRLTMPYPIPVGTRLDPLHYPQLQLPMLLVVPTSGLLLHFRLKFLKIPIDPRRLPNLYGLACDPIDNT